MQATIRPWVSRMSFFILYNTTFPQKVNPQKSDKTGSKYDKTCVILTRIIQMSKCHAPCHYNILMGFSTLYPHLGNPNLFIGLLVQVRSGCHTQYARPLPMYRLPTSRLQCSPRTAHQSGVHLYNFCQLLV